MFLEKLQLNGFKSFAQNVELKFVRGITAIVGPNGSGKSNIADAIRWVLGEQSIKSIRGKKSADVIFAGSDKKARLGLAEVMLYFNNEDNTAPIDYSELVIGRRFYRSGEGEYLINNNRTRLTDIQLLMAKANVGHRTYSVIGQGQIDAVLVATPAERKDFFDEATGVKQYQLKRDQALNKLEHAFVNLKQGKLMLHEMEPHLKMLTKQVRRLEQKELVEKDLLVYQNYLYYHRWHESAQIQASLSDQIVVLEKELSVLTVRSESLANELQAEGLNYSREDEYAKLQEKYEELQKQRQEYQRQLAIFAGQKDLKLASQKGHDAVWARRKIQELDDKIKTTDQKLVGKGKKLEDLKKQLVQKIAQQAELAASFSDFEKKITTAGKVDSFDQKIKQQLSQILSQIKNLKKQWQKKSTINTTEVLDALVVWEEQIDVLLQTSSSSDDTEKFKQTIVDLKNSLQQASFNRDNLVNEIGELRAEIRASETDLNHLRQQSQDWAGEKDQLSSLAAFGDQKTDVSAAEEKVQAQLQVATEQIDQINLSLKDFNKKEQAKKDELLKKQAHLQTIQQSIQHHQKELSDLTAQKARFEAKEEDLALETHRELGKYLAELVDDWKKQVPSLEMEMSDEELLAKIDQLKKKREMIGGIEPEAVTEYQQVREKYDFLTTQVDDLTSAMNKLKDTIVELDEIISRQFSDNFKKIGELFNTYFRMLFSGGRAELVLLAGETDKTEDSLDTEEITAAEENIDQFDRELSQEEDELKKFYQSKKFIQGIDIKATPPGKKMKGIAMLSGGERALTSIALICAMIANNPSPFVVLDEVDAALDEANSLRFAEIVAELSKQTQFVIITHNRATMEKADILYGVTMGADGVSDLLSVKFEEAQEYANRY